MRPELPVVLAAGYAGGELMAAATLAGAIAVLQKEAAAQEPAQLLVAFFKGLQSNNDVADRTG